MVIDLLIKTNPMNGDLKREFQLHMKAWIAEGKGNQHNERVRRQQVQKVLDGLDTAQFLVVTLEDCKFVSGASAKHSKLANQVVDDVMPS